MLDPPEKTDWPLRKSNYSRTLEKRETVSESSRKTPGSILRSLPTFLTGPAEYNAYRRPKNPVPGARK